MRGLSLLFIGVRNMPEHTTVCTTHGVDGLHPNSPDCPICVLIKDGEELNAKIIELESKTQTFDAVSAELEKAKLKIIDLEKQLIKLRKVQPIPPDSAKPV